MTTTDKQLLYNNGKKATAVISFQITNYFKKQSILITSSEKIDSTFIRKCQKKVNKKAITAICVSTKNKLIIKNVYIRKITLEGPPTPYYQLTKLELQPLENHYDKHTNRRSDGYLDITFTSR